MPLAKSRGFRSLGWPGSIPEESKLVVMGMSLRMGRALFDVKLGHTHPVIINVLTYRIHNIGVFPLRMRGLRCFSLNVRLSAAFVKSKFRIVTRTAQCFNLSKKQVILSKV
jgi:hypothetical protein